MQPEDAIRPARRFGQSVNVERRGVRRQDRVWLHDAIEPLKNVALYVDVLEDRFDDGVDVRELVPIVGEGNGLRPLPGFLLCKPAFLDLVHEHAHYGLTGLVDRGIVVVNHDDGNAGLRKRDRDAAAHRPGSDHAATRNLFTILTNKVHAIDRRQLALRKKDVAQRERWRGANELVEESSLARQAERKR